MAAISDALGIAHFDCGRGSNVEGTFLVAIADALGLGDEARTRSIERNIDLLMEHLTGEEGAGLTYHSVEGTITNRALNAILSEVIDRGFAVVPLDHGAPAARIALARAAEDEDPGAEAGAIEALELSDERKRSLRAVVVREGQSRFRAAVLRAYRGRCAITGTDFESVLEAAHIRPYRGKHTNFVSNGLLLRADLHRMWDVGLLAVDEVDRTVLIANHITAPEYTALRGRPIAIPDDVRQHPLAAALQAQRQWAGL
ncbi:HNH endonuclease [Cellulomonas xylanilytica]|uniref:HNH nuclease domain-containing protein n=1 Tax=Cellulomonas xylanilytica TaxID=233583 RepID=A0A510V677_9CELL|nr:HNH endonuclease [Cellulomonas xylanilytica]GEK22377.1 hypothetical protein CXY01_28970 [Cellulomonas xylanilytica]